MIVKHPHWEAPLAAAHRGYTYQDLLTAIRLVDVILGGVVQVDVDRKLFSSDHFDDLTTVNPDGDRERTQFKNRDDSSIVLPLKTFQGKDNRSLGLVELLQCVNTDRRNFGDATTFRVVLRDARPTDPSLTAVLRQVTDDDPGAFVRGMRSLRLRFDPDAIWPLLPHGATRAQPTDPFKSIKDGRFAREEFAWLCQHLVVEVEAAEASFDLLQPGPAEQLLLDRVQRELGAGLYPNAHRSPVDVAFALIGAATRAREKVATATASEVLRATQLRTDLGAVARKHPVDSSLEVLRETTVDDLVAQVEDVATKGGAMLLVGAPGQGKSWLSHQLQQRLSEASWVVAEHYCFLGDADLERSERVLIETIWGSLLARLAEHDLALVSEQRPRFAADETALVDAVRRTQGRTARVALLVDGIDHISRVRALAPHRDPSRAVVESLAGMEIPAGCALIVLSQPGDHLAALRRIGAVEYQVPALAREELRQLATRQGLLVDDSSPATTQPATDEDVLDALAERSRGNALYATYLCREALRHSLTPVDASLAIRQLPSFDGTLENYYAHLVQGLEGAGWVADVLSLLEFSVTRKDLKEIHPETAHRVDQALDALKPVLIERAGQGGLRVYHESFSRFLRRAFDGEPSAMHSTLAAVVKWLGGRGFLEDSRAFRFLIPTLVRTGNDREAVDLVQPSFVASALASGFSADAIVANLAEVVTAATKVGDWPSVLKCVELAAATRGFEFERLESEVVRFVDVPLSLLGATTFAERLLFDGRTTMPARIGLQFCAAVDSAGHSAPWNEYMAAFIRERKQDNTSYGEVSDHNVAIAWLRGKLRATLNAQSPAALAELLDWAQRFIKRSSLDADRVVQVISDAIGVEHAETIGSHLASASVALAIAERRYAQGESVAAEEIQGWVRRALEWGLPAGNVHRVIALLPDEAVSDFLKYERAHLLQLTRDVQESRSGLEHVRRWLDLCKLASRIDTFGLVSAEALIAGDGWYKCWLRFVLRLCAAEAQTGGKDSSGKLEAIRVLVEDVRPFVGDPRACDLYQIHGAIAATLHRALVGLDDLAWGSAIQILQEVSDATTTSLQGGLGGPVSPDTLLDLVLSGAAPSRADSARGVVYTATGEPTARFYGSIAGYHLAAAKLEILVGDLTAAKREWISACKLFGAYTFRKDPTIYGLLDPLDALASLSPDQVRKRLGALQVLAQRVVRHTDGKGTRGATAAWWRLLAAVDPKGVTDLVVPELLEDANHPFPLLDDTRDDIWRAHGPNIDPILAGALRLTLGARLEPEDPTMVARLLKVNGARDIDETNLAQVLVARADERTVRYGFSNGHEFVAKDNAVVDELNRVIANVDLSPVLPTVVESPSETNHAALTSTRPDTALAGFLDETTRPFEAGAVGLGRAVRAWRSKPYASGEDTPGLERFSNVIGYRMIQLADQGGEADVEAALWTLADEFEFKRELLGALAEGLERHGLVRLAAVAHTLVWTRTRGGGGWLSFGGESQLDSLQRAAKLDPALTLQSVADEVRGVLMRNQGTAGITQALVLAFTKVDFGRALATNGIEVAFAAWDAAMAVIAERLPATRGDEVAYLPYLPGATIGTAESAAIAATLAGFAHPSREKKRRSLLALRILLAAHAAATATALGGALNKLRDPSSLIWILDEIARARPEAVASVVEACTPRLQQLAGDEHLGVRVTARRLLTQGGGTAPALPAFDPDRDLIRGPLGSNGRGTIELPQGSFDDLKDPVTDVNVKVVRAFAGQRLARAEQTLPGLAQASARRFSALTSTDEHREREKEQFEALASRAERIVPDAYLAREEALDRAMQLAAGTGRSAVAVLGGLLPDPLSWEERLAQTIGHDDGFALAVENAREPRPSLVPPPSYDGGHLEISRKPTGSIGVMGHNKRGRCDLCYDQDRQSCRLFAVRGSGALPRVENNRVR